MERISTTITQYFKDAILAAFPQLTSEGSFPLEIVQASQEKFGHYQFNSAMKLVKLVGSPPGYR